MNESMNESNVPKEIEVSVEQQGEDNFLDSHLIEPKNIDFLNEMKKNVEKDFNGDSRISKKISPTKILELLKTIREILSVSTAHGIPKIIMSKNLSIKIMWSVF